MGNSLKMVFPSAKVFSWSMYWLSIPNPKNWANKNKIKRRMVILKECFIKDLESFWGLNN